MKHKMLNAALILTSVIAYIEWGLDSSAFLLQVEVDMLKKLFTDPASVIHPFTVIPLAGQLMLLFTLFQQKPGRALTISGIACLGLLLLFVFLIGIRSGNIRMIASVLPFIIISIYTIVATRKKKM